MIDKSLHFGLQNLIFVKQDDISDVNYTYVGYQDRKGSTLIAKYAKDDSEGLYYVASGVFVNIWAGRNGYTYKLPSALVDPTV